MVCVVRRLLFIAYDFPPGNSIGASLRSSFFARYLPEFGWQPTVVALDSGQATVTGVIRLASATPWRRPYEVTPYGWAFTLRRWLKAQPPDAWDLVYVSCPPFPQALTAAGYTASVRLPLVVDFRDAWSLDPYQEGSRLKRWLYRHVFPRQECHLLSRTDLLILNTPSSLSAHQSHYSAFASRMVYLPNGFDNAAFETDGSAAKPADDTFRLLYAGRFGIGGRSPERLLEAVIALRRNGCRIQLDIVGRQPPGLASVLQAAEQSGAIRLIDQVDYSQVVPMICHADTLVLLQAPSDSIVQAVAGKTYDYLRSGRAILAVAPAGDNLALVRSYADQFEIAEDTVPAINEALKRLYTHWTAGELNEMSAGPNPGFVERFERRSLTRELAAHFDRVMANGNQ